MRATILVLGASEVWGAFDDYGGWVERLKVFSNKKYLSDYNHYSPVYNLGISGDTTGHMLKRFEFEIKERLKEEKNALIILSFGGNDISLIGPEKKLRVAYEESEKNIKAILEKSQEISNTVIVKGPHKIDEKRTNPVVWDKDLSLNNSDGEKYNELIKKVCRECGIHFIDMFDLLANEDLLDGVHPNTEGHRKLFEKVKDYLLENKLI